MIFSKKRDLTPVFIFFISFSTYLFTATPTFYWRDGAEFQTVGFTLGIAHPSGFPLYSIVAKLFTMLPMGSVAFKVTLLSAVFGGLTATLVYFIVGTILKYFSTEQGAQEKPIQFIALSAALLFSFSNALWENSNIPEVYTLINAFTALFILISVCRVVGSPDASEGGLRSLFFFAFLFGLSLGAHSVEILYLPVLLVLFYSLWLRPIRLKVPKYGFLILFFLILGFSVYLYLPIRASQEPYFNWGDPQTLRQFLTHVTDRKDQKVHFAIPRAASVLLPQILNYSRFYPSNFSILGIGLGLSGLIYLIRRNKKIAFILAGFFFPPFIFFIRFWGDSSNYLSGLLVFTVLIGVGSGWAYSAVLRLIRGFRLSSSAVWIFWTALAMNILILSISHLAQNNKSGYWIPEKIFKTSLLDLENNAIVFTRESYFNFSYLQQVENVRPDVSHLSNVDFLQPDFFFKATQARLPLVSVPSADAETPGSIFLSENIGKHPIYWEPDGGNNYVVAPYLSLDGMFFRILESPPPISEERLNSYRKKLKTNLDLDRLSLNYEESRFYGNFFFNIGSHLLEDERYDVALQHFEMAYTLMPTDYYLLNFIGVSHGQLGNSDKAEEYFKKLLSVDPFHLDAQRNLGLLYLEGERYQEAEEALLKAERIQPQSAETNYRLGLLYDRMGEKEKALLYMEKVLKEDPKHAGAQEKRELLRGSAQGV